MKHLSLLSISFALFLSACTQPTVTKCPETDEPVCGKVQIQCVTTPCDPIDQTFANRCHAERSGAEDVIDGACAHNVPEGVEVDRVPYSNSTTGYIAKPSGDGPYPAVILIHEWWGLNENIEWYAEQFAAQGYVALAVDLYNGQSTTDPANARVYASEVRSDKGAAFDNLQAAVDYVSSLPEVDTARIASVGWCFGGGWSYEMAKNNLGTAASVIYYGQFNPEDDLQQMRTTIMGHFGEDDQAIPIDDVKAFQANLQTLNGKHQIFIYENEGHGFARELTTKSARTAWERTLKFLEEEL